MRRGFGLYLSLITLVDNVKTGIDPHGTTVSPKEFLADVVKGAPPEQARGNAGQVLDPGQHFLRRFVGEGEQQNPGRRDSLIKQPGDPVGKGARLAGTRTRQNERRTSRGGDGRILFVVEFRPVFDACRRPVWRTVRSFKKIHSPTVEGRGLPRNLRAQDGFGSLGCDH